MKPTPRADLESGAGVGRLAEISLAVRSGRLVSLLRGEGLTKRTVEELLRPESIPALKAILAEHLFLEPERGARKDGTEER